MNNIMHILFGINDGFVMPCGVLMESVLRTNKTEKIVFHIITNHISEDNQQKLRTTAGTHADVNFYTVADYADLLQGFLQIGSWGISIYFRLFATKLLPPDVSKVLYLDADMLVTDSLTELWNTDLTDCSVAVAINHNFDNIVRMNTLQYDRNEGYFNSGMLLINLDYWRKNDIAEKIFDYIQKNSKILQAPDQYALNAITAGTRKLVPFRYNMNNVRNVANMQVRREWHEMMRESQIHPAIIHFIGVKPWHRECTHPYQPLWLYVQSQTLWKYTKLRSHTPKSETLKCGFWTILKGIKLILISLFGQSFVERIIFKKKGDSDTFYLKNAEKLLEKLRN